ncbi:sensor histidine kinase [Vibrio scophthalmi]|uniref:sensor histidine kinase n=1 Tax=Vibrio scophthalmi TaxID=45658 RepID=UPI002FF0F4D5
MVSKPAWWALHLESSRKVTVWIVVITTVLAIVMARLWIESIETRHFAQLDTVGEERLNLYASTVEAEYQRFHYLPFIAAQDDEVQQLLATPEKTQLIDEVNQKLAQWQSESGADALYLMDKSGRVLASSNWNQEGSFVGHDYHFRPYFTEAMAGRNGRFFAIGVTTGEPGLFLSRPVRVENQIVGVTVLKVDMSQLEASWRAGGEGVWVSDADGVIFLASQPHWRYRTLGAISDQVREALRQAQKYANHPIEPLSYTALPSSPQGKTVLDLRGEDGVATRYVLHQRDIRALGWRLVYLSDLQDLTQNKYNAMIVAALLATVLALVALYLMSRFRHQQQLEWRVAQRTNALRQSNSQLKREIEERIRTENILRQTNEELIQAEKLAALGQLSAELVHEISQPLQATLTYLASTQLLVERGGYEMAQENLDEIDHLIRRVTKIISRLKHFASKSVSALSPVDIAQSVRNALVVVQPRLDKHRIVLDWQPPESALLVRAEEIKLEQVLVNLLRNAADAIAEDANAAKEDDANGHREQGKIQIRTWQQGSEVLLSVTDNGAGIAAEHLASLFEPFFTTKPAGKGVGLGLSVSRTIVEEFGGQLEVIAADKGCEFRLKLQCAESPEAELRSSS